MVDTTLKSDEEKAEELKAWWKANGTSVIAGVALAIGGMFGWQQWQQHKLDQAEGASKLFSEISKPEADSLDIVKKLNADYGSTGYAALASLSAAKAACEAGKTDICIEQLRTATKSSQNNIADIAKIRLARTLITAGKLDEANTILSEKLPAAYESLITELKGDILYAKKEYAKAREAYDHAILSSGGQNTEALILKRNDLGDNLRTNQSNNSGDKLKTEA